MPQNNSAIKLPVRVDDGNAIIDSEGSIILVANVHYRDIIPEAAHKLNGYGVAVKALKKLRLMWITDSDPSAESDIVDDTLEALGELNENMSN